MCDLSLENNFVWIWILAAVPRLVYRGLFAIAIKIPRNDGDTQEIDLFLDEAKSMLEIGSYHDNIVNLQGIAYEMNVQQDYFTEVLHTVL